MEGGNPGTLVVPEKCYLFVDRYVVPGETDEICIAQIMEAAEQLGLSGKVDVRLKPRKSPYMQSFAVEEDRQNFAGGVLLRHGQGSSVRV